MTANPSIKPVLLTTSFCPSIWYIAILQKTAEVLLEAHETYHKQTFRNRCEILSANGRYSITVPVSLPSGSRTKTKDVLVSNQENWRQKQWRAIESAYNNSPYFLYYKDEIEKIFLDKTINGLFDLNLLMIHAIMEALEINVSISATEDFEKKPDTCLDLRDITKKHGTCNQDQLFPPYPQVFDVKFPFQANLSILDLLFNEGPASSDYLKQIKVLD
jgi:hypothetical protein